MKRSLILPVLLGLALPLQAQENAPLQFAIDEGGNQNRFYQSAEDAYHVRLTNPDNPRLIMAFPAGNAGASFTFDPSFAENHGLRFQEVSASPWFQTGIRGAQVSFTADRSSIVLSQTILDTMRMSRTSAYKNYPEQVAARGELARALGFDPEGWATAKVSVEGNTIAFTRRTLDGENHFAGSISFDGPVSITRLSDGAFKITRTDGKPLSVHAEAGDDYKPLTPLRLDQILNEKGLEVYKKALGDLQDTKASASTRADAQRLVESVDARRFLTYDEKILAGSHRFNTYFGRDTMLGTLLGWDMLTLDAKESAIRSVLDRLSPEGIVAHEEDIGAMAELRHVDEALGLARAGKLDEARAVLARGQEPIYDYKMVDGEFLLPLLVERWAKDPALSQERRAALLRSKSIDGKTSYGDLLVRGLRRAVSEAAPWAKAYEELARAHPGLGAAELAKLPEFRDLAQHLVDFHPGENVGDWRDSNWGNGLGKFSGGINENLVPHALDALNRLPLALDALTRLAKSGVLTPAQKGALDETLRRTGFMGSLERLAETWRHARDHFKVTLTADEARARLEKFLAQVPEEVRSFYESQVVERGVTLGDWLGGKKAPSLDRGLEFSAIALDEKGNKIPVMYSDVVQSLWFGDPSPAQLSKSIEVLERPFPLGLRTDVGMVIANAALSDREGDFKVFNRGAYHGNVIWSWQEAQLKQALARQIDRMNAIGTPEALAVRDRLASLFDNAVVARRNAGELANSELWSFEVKGGKLVAHAYDGAAAGADSNPVQFWGTDGVATEIAASGVREARSRGLAGTLDRGFTRGAGSEPGTSILGERTSDRALEPSAEER